MHKGDTKNIYECMLLEDRIITILNGYIMKNIYECKLVEDRTITMHKRDVIKNIYIMKNIVESNVLDRVCFICYLSYYMLIHLMQLFFFLIAADFEWVWDHVQCGDATSLQEQGCLVTFHENFSRGTSAIRGLHPMDRDQHFWEIKMTTPVYGTDMVCFSL